MSREEIQKLVGGYATGTLTREEQEALFAAALADQELFDSLAREQALRDLLSDPAAKAQILATLAEPPRRWYRTAGWLGLSAAVAMAGVALLIVVTVRQRQAPMPVSAPAPLVAEVKREGAAPQRPNPQAAAQPGGVAVRSARPPAKAPRKFQASYGVQTMQPTFKAAESTPPPPPLPSPQS
ncbi:MAG TPA: hypothetical protein VL359_12805, partial [bacterium]|nr:hypothetical protein [bacterium]